MIKRKLNSILTIILGDREVIEPERYFISFTCFAGSIVLALLCGFHQLSGMKSQLVILGGSSSIATLALFFYIRYNENLFFPKLILSLLGLLFLDLAWYFKFLSNGPLLYFIFAFGALLIWAWHSKALYFMLVAYVFNILLLFWIEYKAPLYLFEYPGKVDRSIDIYLSFILYFAMMAFILFTVKKDFIIQKERAIKSDLLKTAFLANMSHEIRTPMNSIIGFSELSAVETDPLKREQYVNIIKNSGRTLLLLINDIIDLSKIEAGDLTMNYCDFSISALFFELREVYSVELIKREKSNVRIQYLLPQGEFIIHSDPIRIKQIISNLLSNAVKFSTKGEITFTCEKNSEEIIFSVSDTGTGIPKEDQKKIFERFTKFNYQGMNTEGSGIGLSIVEKIVTLLNGRIWLISEPGQGSTFSFAIPNIPTLRIPVQTKNMEVKYMGEKELLKKKILLVEDDKNSMLLIKEILQKIDVEIYHVPDGKDAIEYIRENPETCLILMDIKLSTMDGYETTTEIRKINSTIPIIAQTAFALMGDKEKAICAGCNDYITKPLDAKNLQTIVNSYLS